MMHRKAAKPLVSTILSVVKKRKDIFQSSNIMDVSPCKFYPVLFEKHCG